MAKVRVVDYAPAEHQNHMRWVDDEQRKRYEHSGHLVPYKVCTVEVCGFQFVFHSLMQVELCLDYYSRKVQPTSRLPVHTQNLGGDHWETQRWFEKLPLVLLENSKRPKVIAALQRALREYGAHPEAKTSTPKPALWERPYA
jgi:hypothetical protein